MKLIIVSNRLPFTLSEENGSYRFKSSSGGLVSALATYLEKTREKDYLWMGWPGVEVVSSKQKALKQKTLSEMSSQPVFLPQESIENFYEGFCNKIIWPLFHYFPSLVTFEEKFWVDYKKINQVFADAIVEAYKPGDTIWIHDYHFMLLPALIRKKLPKAKIGFFLHIPFPSYEIFRLLPSEWREEILKGLLGADLIGFHTHEYTEYFLRCVMRILGWEHSLGKILVGDRVVQAATFPLGIDFDKFQNSLETKGVKIAKQKLKSSLKDFKVVLSIDRLDYTKGILNRLLGYEMFLDKNPKWQKKIILVLVAIPSRIAVEQYQDLKKQMEQLIGRINGKFGTISWTPISYQYSSVPFDDLIALYSLADVALVTPLRDGMNLIAKEYIASKNKDDAGVLILSEMAGSAKELGEAIIINPNSKEEIAYSLKQALEIPKRKQIKNNNLMQERLRDYNVVKWGEHFIQLLQEIKLEQKNLQDKVFTNKYKQELISEFTKAKRRLIFLDYDGTLAPIASLPSLARPSKAVLQLLKNLATNKKNEIVLISGRDKETLDKWFGNLPISLVAEHGVLLKEKWANWKVAQPMDQGWKKDALNILKMYTDVLPGALIEEKNYSVAWHYRNADPLLANSKAKELLDDLVHFTANRDLSIVAGSKVIEIKSRNLHKGVAASRWLSRQEFDLVLALGDDQTDEDLFSILPESAYSMKIGMSQTHAKFILKKHSQVFAVLKSLQKK